MWYFHIIFTRDIFRSERWRFSQIRIKDADSMLPCFSGMCVCVCVCVLEGMEMRSDMRSERNGMHLFHFLFVGRRPWDPSKRTKRSRSAPRKLLAASGSAHSSPKSGEVDRWKYVAILICRQCWLFLTDFLAICGYNCCKVRAIWGNLEQFWAIFGNFMQSNFMQLEAI